MCNIFMVEQFFDKQRDVNNNFFSFLELQDRRNSVTYGELEGYRLSYEEERKKE